MEQGFNFNIYNVQEVDRVTFIRKTYAHVAYAILGFLFFETFLFTSGIAQSIAVPMISNWWLVIVLFMGGSFLGNKWAAEPGNKQKQYLGLFFFSFLYALLFVPLLTFLFNAPQFAGQVTDILGQAGVVTLGLFTGLSAVALFSKTDFSFLGSIVTIGSFIALGLIFGGMIFGFNLGLWFSVAMVVLMAGSILYQTSQLVHNYHTSQHVAAAIGLFASFMTLFWYILQIFMSSRD